MEEINLEALQSYITCFEEDMQERIALYNQIAGAYSQLGAPDVRTINDLKMIRVNCDLAIFEVNDLLRKLPDLTPYEVAVRIKKVENCEASADMGLNSQCIRLRAHSKRIGPSIKRAVFHQAIWAIRTH